MKWDVSIGIPVYNGEDLLENTLQNLLEYHSDVKEIIISDNASTDKTPQICKKYADKYPIIKYSRQKEFVSIYYNGLEVLKRSTGKYYLYMGHHDLLSENFFSETIPMLEENVGAVVALTKVYGFQSPFNKSNLQMLFDPTESEINSEDKLDRIYSALTSTTMCTICNQVFRTDFCRRMSDEIFIKGYNNIDVVMPLYAALLGEIVKAPNAAFYFWMRPNETGAESDKRYSFNTKTNITGNHRRYIPRLYWELCKKYAAELSDELLKTDIDFAFSHLYNFYMNEDDWTAKVILEHSKEEVPYFRAYSAIYIALKYEKIYNFYKNLRYGRKSIFENMAKEVAADSYNRMLELLLDEKFLFPTYRLTIEETKMLNQLMLLKAEDA